MLHSVLSQPSPYFFDHCNSGFCDFESPVPDLLMIISYPHPVGIFTFSAIIVLLIMASLPIFTSSKRIDFSSRLKLLFLKDDPMMPLRTMLPLVMPHYTSYHFEFAAPHHRKQCLHGQDVPNFQHRPLIVVEIQFKCYNYKPHICGESIAPHPSIRPELHSEQYSSKIIGI